MADKQIVNMEGTIQNMDVIEHDGGFWLVPMWLISPDGKTKKPVRIISIRMAGTDTPAPRPVLTFFQNNIMPRSLFERGQIPPETGRALLVRENPEISVPNPKSAH